MTAGRGQIIFSPIREKVSQHMFSGVKGAYSTNRRAGQNRRVGGKIRFYLLNLTFKIQKSHISQICPGKVQVPSQNLRQGLILE